MDCVIILQGGIYQEIFTAKPAEVPALAAARIRNIVAHLLAMAVGIGQDREELQF